MKQFLGLAFAGVLAAIVAGCGGGGGDGGPITGGPITGGTQYAGVADVLGEDCDYAVGVITTRSGTASGARNSAYQTCESQATTQAAGAARDRCDAGTTTECVAIAVGTNSSGRCQLSTRSAVSLSNAQSSALQGCRSGLGSSADCNLLVSGCASGAPSTRVWRPSGGGGGNGGNGAPQAAAARTLSGDVGDSWTWTRAQLESAFSDPDGDTLTYRATSNLAAVASASISSSGLRIEANAAGTATISVTATDPGGLSATWRLRVTVNQSSPTLYYGALSIDLRDCRSNTHGIVGGLASGYTSRAAARNRAIDTCVRSGGIRSHCSTQVAEFGSAYGASSQCFALVFGKDSSGCGTFNGRGSAERAAQSNARLACQRDGYTNCIIVQGNQGTFAACAN